MTVCEAGKTKAAHARPKISCEGGERVNSFGCRVVGTLTLVLALAATGSAEDKKKKNSDIENIGVRDINKGSINFISLDKEIALGRELAKQVEQESKLLNDAVINEYVNWHVLWLMRSLTSPRATGRSRLPRVSCCNSHRSRSFS